MEALIPSFKLPLLKLPTPHFLLDGALNLQCACRQNRYSPLQLILEALNLPQTYL
jgi:hypothetical protein